MSKRGFKPYRARSSGLTAREVSASLNRRLYAAYGIEYANGEDARVEMEPLPHYERLLEDLCAHGNVAFATHHDVAVEPRRTDAVVVTIRHDVDVDIITALELARIEHRLGIPATYYLLHTAPYYGRMQSGVFERHESMLWYYQSIRDLGHEVSLHNDALHLYQGFGVDGASGLVKEIEWLRENGIAVPGSCAHNSAPVYGAENRAIFKGQLKPGSYRGLIDRGVVPALTEASLEVHFKGHVTPLQVLDPAELGLEYEALDLQAEALSSTSEVAWEYAALRSANAWNSKLQKARVPRAAWYEALARWPGVGPQSLFCFASTDEVVAGIVDLPAGSHALVNVHPVYYGRRTGAETGPLGRWRSRPPRCSVAPGWVAHAPGETVADFHDAEGRLEYAAANQANALGMLDVGCGDTAANDAVRPSVLLLGSTNVDGATINLDTQLHRQVRKLLAEVTGDEVRVAKLAYEDMGIARLDDWLAWGLEHARPSIVVLRVGADEAALSLPMLWSRLTGYSAANPPGAYLAADTTGSLVRRERSALAPLDAVRPDEVPRAASLALEPDALAAILDDLAGLSVEGAVAQLNRVLLELSERVQGAGCQLVLLVEECGETAGLWKDEASARRAVTNFGNVLNRLTAGCDLAVCNPYPAMLDGGHRAIRRFWGARPVWSEHTHRQVALHLAPLLLERLAPPPGRAAPDAAASC